MPRTGFFRDLFTVPDEENIRTTPSPQEVKTETKAVFNLLSLKYGRIVHKHLG